jgi:hypothetical protein
MQPNAIALRWQSPAAHHTLQERQKHPALGQGLKSFSGMGLAINRCSVQKCGRKRLGAGRNFPDFRRCSARMSRLGQCLLPRHRSLSGAAALYTRPMRGGWC